MKSVAVISSGFLRNYRFFLETDFYRALLNGFKCDFYIAAWEEDGYGDNSTPEYSGRIIPDAQVRGDFGDRLKLLHRDSFAGTRGGFRYDPVMRLLCHEPHVLEKYRSKFHMVERAEVPEGYDAYFHVRFDMDPYREMAEAILECLSGFSASDNVAYTAADILGRPGCFGDVFQIFDHPTYRFFQGANRRLYDPAYLSLDIPEVPERILHHYFSTELPDKPVRQIPFGISLNRRVY